MYYFRPVAKRSGNEVTGAQINQITCSIAGSSFSEALVTLEKAASIPFTNPGATFEYTITLTNVGDTELTNLTLVDTLPDGFTFTDTSVATKTWTVDSLIPNEIRVFTYGVVVTEAATDGNYDNIVIASIGEDKIAETHHLIEVRTGLLLAEEFSGTFEELPDTGSQIGLYYFLVLGLVGAGAIVYRLFQYGRVLPLLESRKINLLTQIRHRGNQ